MSTPHRLLEQNQAWRTRKQERSPDIFRALAQGQSPDVLWIGCADSRVPPTQIVDGEAGDLFVHRNVANLVHPSDANGMSVVQYAVDELEVSHIIVCGHTRCGGVQAVLSDATEGWLDDWLQPLRTDLEEVLAPGELDGLDEQDRWDRCCEANVQAQVQKLAQTDTVQQAWARGQTLSVHGWLYELGQGRIRDLDTTLAATDFA